MVGVVVVALLAGGAALFVVSRGKGDSSPSRLTGRYVDTAPDHWRRLDTYPADVEYEARAFNGGSVLILRNFPVNMSGCDSGQTRIAWRALNGVKVAPGITSFLDPGMRPEDYGTFGVAAESGTMVIGNCEQPMWKRDGGNFHIVVEAGFYGPAVGHASG